MRYFEKCVTSGSCLHLTVQKSRLWSYQKVIRLSSLIQSKLLEIIVDYIRGEQLLISFHILVYFGIYVPIQAPKTPQ